MHLYYTGEDDGGPTITYSYTRSAPERSAPERSAPEGTMTAFDDTIKRIMKRDFHRFADVSRGLRRMRLSILLQE